MCRSVPGAVLSLLLAACTAPGQGRAGAPPDTLAQVAVPRIPGVADSAHPRIRQVVYVPIYSHIYWDRNRHINLAATLSVRNTDPERSLTLTAVQYFNTAGRLVRVYRQRPLTLAPLASTEFIVAQQDTVGGSGANFLVEWTAEGRITEPVIEAVMVSASGSLEFSFVSVGRPLLRR